MDKTKTHKGLVTLTPYKSDSVFKNREMVIYGEYVWYVIKSEGYEITIGTNLTSGLRSRTNKVVYPNQLSYPIILIRDGENGGVINLRKADWLRAQRLDCFKEASTNSFVEFCVNFQKEACLCKVGDREFNPRETFNELRKTSWERRQKVEKPLEPNHLFPREVRKELDKIEEEFKEEAKKPKKIDLVPLSSPADLSVKKMIEDKIETEKSLEERCLNMFYGIETLEKDKKKLWEGYKKHRHCRDVLQDILNSMSQQS